MSSHFLPGTVIAMELGLVTKLLKHYVVSGRVKSVNLISWLEFI